MDERHDAAVMDCPPDRDPPARSRLRFSLAPALAAVIDQAQIEKRHVHVHRAPSLV